MSLHEQKGLADAAHVLSDQLRSRLEELAVLASPHTNRLDKRFAVRLRELKFDARQATALSSITFGAAARQISAGGTPAQFFEHVSRSGRRLAKLNVAPADVLEALEEYDALLDQVWQQLPAPERGNARWVRDQIHFCIVLSLNNAYYQVREAETQAVYQVMGLDLESSDLDSIYSRFLRSMADICRAGAARLFLLEPGSGSARLAASLPEKANGSEFRLRAPERRRLSRPLCVSNGTSRGVVLDSKWRKQFESVWSIPFSRNGALAGIMQFAFPEQQEWLPREIELFTAAAERCMMAADRARLLQNLAARENQLKELSEHMLHVEEMERRRISRELHDDAGQSLVCIRLQLELVELDMPAELTELRARLQEVRDLTEKTILDIRRLIADLSPAVLEQLGLGAAVRQLINRFRKSYPCAVRLYVGNIPEIPQMVQIVTYRLLQECCNNIAQHSSATNVNISVTAADGVLKLNVKDNGVGFQTEIAFAKHKSFGLAGMRERVALLGGRFELKSEPPKKRGKGKGTEIRIELPLLAAENTLSL